jgi:hypothetical protein
MRGHFLYALVITHVRPLEFFSDNTFSCLYPIICPASFLEVSELVARVKDCKGSSDDLQ